MVVVINIYYLCSWWYAYNARVQQRARLQFLSDLFPSFIGLQLSNTFALIFTLAFIYKGVSGISVTHILRKTALYTVILSVVLDAYCLVGWLYSYVSYNSVEARINLFGKLFPAFMPMHVLNPLTLSITTLSVILLFVTKEDNTISSFRFPIISLQLLFMLYSTWQYM